MKGKDLLNKLAEKSGIAIDDKDLVKFITDNPALEFPDAFANACLSNLMNEKEAKEHAPIVKHFTHSVLGGVDDKIHTSLDAFGLDDVIKGKIKGEKNSYEKAILLAREIQALERAKIGAGKGEKDALQKEIEAKDAQILQIGKDYEAKLKSVQDTSSSEITDFAIDAYLASMNYANKDLPKEANIATARYLLNQELGKAGAKIVRDGKTLKLVRTDDTGLPYKENHQDVTFQGLTDRILSTNKLLSVGNSTTNTPQGQTQQNAAQRQVQVPVDSTITDSFYENQMKVFSNGHAQA